MKVLPIVAMPQMSDDAWHRLTKQPEDPVEKILRENQIDLLEVLDRAKPA